MSKYIHISCLCISWDLLVLGTVNHALEFMGMDWCTRFALQSPQTGLRCDESKISCKNEDDQSRLEMNNLLKNTETVIDVVTEHEAKDVTKVMKKTPTVRKIEETTMKMKKGEK